MPGWRDIFGGALAPRGLRLVPGRGEQAATATGPIAAATEPVVDVATKPAVEAPPLSRSATTLAEVSKELADWVPVLRRLAEAEALRDLALGHSTEISGAAVRSIIASRRLRDEYFWPAMNETAWTLLLELFASRLEGRPVDMTGLGAATGTPFATTVHWLDWLCGRRVAFRDERAKNEADVPVGLTEAGAEEMRAYLLASLRLSPWVQ